jgi:hypothetical protein
MHEETEVVNVFEYYKSFGLSDFVATQLVLHMLMTRTYCVESDAREIAAELNISLPYIMTGNDTSH